MLVLWILICDPNFTGNRAIAGPKCKHYYTGLFGTHKLVFYYQRKPKNRRLYTAFGAFTYKTLMLWESSTQFDVGLTFLRWPTCKITAQYSTRPVYTAQQIINIKGDFIVQLQIYL
jgi:hypothetical protein